MDKKEFSTFAMALRTYYPKEQILPNQQAMELWYRELCDIPYNVAEAGLRKWVISNKWSPSIAEIREMTTSVSEGDIPDWGEGWEQVLVAIRKYGSYREKEAMDSMDDITKQCVTRLGFKNICMSENIASDRANFRMIYEQLAARKKVDQKMPPQLKSAIQGLLESNERKGQIDESKRLS